AYLPKVSPPTAGSSTEPFYYVYGYDGINVPEAKLTKNYATYGVLYNWQAAKTSCPSGWHLPSDEEWTTLTTFLGGESEVGGKMKETGTTHFYEPNTDATNSSGFSGMPGGGRDYHGGFFNIGRFGVWWSSTESSSTFAWHRTLDYNWNGIGHPTYYKMDGYSVRCIKD
ncbi:MAG: fibrobacter succinogenes major paralogous domain-containing protein, partial [Bacteroidota bacterium]|nr:fibrobacter succinogenes major paralogous domain-containing protein [Bacteroidota bacterium]